MATQGPVHEIQQLIGTNLSPDGLNLVFTDDATIGDMESLVYLPSQEKDRYSDSSAAVSAHSRAEIKTPLNIQPSDQIFLEQCYDKLFPLDLSGAPNLIDKSFLTCDFVRNMYERINYRQSYERNHFFDLMVPNDLQGKFAVVNRSMKELQQTHLYLESTNARIIQEIIDAKPKSKELIVPGKFLTRFPVSVIEKNLNYFRELEVLDCSNNHIQTLPETIGECKNLRMLYCYNNQMNALPESMGSLQALQLLDCSNNQIQTLPKAIGGCQNLRMLYCYNNQMNALPESMGSLQALQLLDYSGNPLQWLPRGLERFRFGVQNPGHLVLNLFNLNTSTNLSMQFEVVSFSAGVGNAPSEYKPASQPPNKRFRRD